MRPHIPPRIACSIAAALILITAVPSPAVAATTNAKIRAKKAEAARAQSHLEDMNAEVEMRVEAYDGVVAQLEETRRRIDVTRAELERADAELAADRERLDRRAVGIYKDGDVGFLEVVLGTTSFDDLLSRLDLLTRVGRADAQLVSNVETARAKVDAARHTLEQREAEQVALRDDAEDKRDQMQAAYAQQQAYVRSLNHEVAKLVAEEKARRKRLAEEAARKAREAEKRRQEAARRLARNANAGVGHPEVVAVALRYLGVPYLWGGTSPSGFDCSGLAQYAYAQIGVSIPRTSRQQFASGTHISADRLDLLAPGDLVFFGRNGDPGQVHHVGIYAGGGRFIEAPYTGGVVQVSSLTGRIASRHDYVGASRF